MIETAKAVGTGLKRLDILQQPGQGDCSYILIKLKCCFSGVDNGQTFELKIRQGASH